MYYRHIVCLFPKLRFLRPVKNKNGHDQIELSKVQKVFTAAKAVTALAFQSGGPLIVGFEDGQIKILREGHDALIAGPFHQSHVQELRILAEDLFLSSHLDCIVPGAKFESHVAIIWIILPVFAIFLLSPHCFFWVPIHRISGSDGNMLGGAADGRVGIWSGASPLWGLRGLRSDLLEQRSFRWGLSIGILE